MTEMSTYKINKQKEVADFVLDKVEYFDPGCILAGGAVRDWYFEKPASDLDIFFHYRTRSTLREIYSLLEKSFGKDIKFSLLGSAHLDGSQYKKNPSLHRVLEAEVSGVKIQLMQMDKPTWNVVDDFPLTICKAWYKKSSCRYEPEFIKTVDKKIIVKTSSLYANGDKYIRKVRDKFPDFEYYESYEQYFKSRFL